MKTSLKTITASVLIAVIIIFGASWYSSANAVLGLGGQIVGVIYCYCSGNIMTIVAGASGGTYMYQPGASRLYAYGQVFRPGPSILGTYSPGGICKIGACIDPSVIIAKGTIITAGTSL